MKRLFQAALIILSAGCFIYLIINPWPLTAERWDKLVSAEKQELEAYQQIGWWFAAAAGGVICLFLAFTSRWWMTAGRERKTAAAIPGWLWAGLIIIVIFAGVIRYPRLHIGYYSDEIYTLKKFVFGKWKEKDGELKFREVKWKETLWDYSRPNNHILFSAAARLPLELSGGKEDVYPKEWQVRLPAYLAGIASIAAGALWLARAGMPSAGLIAALLLTLHPWHIFHSVTVRGYAFVFLFLTVSLWASWEVWRSGKARWWVVMILSNVCLLLTYPGVLYAAGLIQIVLLVALGKSGLMRWLAAQLCAAALLAPWYFTIYLQLKVYLEHYAPQSEKLADGYLGDVACLLLLGTPWHAWDPGNVYHMALFERPLASVLALVLIGALIAAGVWRLFRRNAVIFWLLSAVVFGGVVAFLAARIGNAHLFTWYFVWLLPPLFLTAGAGIFSLVEDMKPFWARAPLAGAAICVFYLMTLEQARVARHVAKEPLKQILSDIRLAQEEKPVIITVWESLGFYDPAISSVYSLPELKEELRRGGARPVYVVFGYRDAVRAKHPELLDFLANPERFELIQRYDGLEHRHSNYTVLILKQTK